MQRLAGLVLLAACASMAPIPGGPEDHAPPTLLTVRPDTNSVNYHGGAVRFQFDEVVNYASGTSGDLSTLFLISPRIGTPRVHWHRSEIDVEPHSGSWRPNTAYAVTLLPGLRDLSNNPTKRAYTVVFSTGPTIPAFGVHGRVFDWLAQRVVPAAVVEVLQRPDSVLYFGIADSTGQFNVGPLPAGTYTVTAYADGNHNLTRDPTELWDSTQVHITDAQPYLEMLAARRDSIGPAIADVSAQDSVTIRVTFDKPLSPDAPLDTAQFAVVTGDSTHLALAAVRTLAQYQAELTARRDSARKADSLAARTDSLKKAGSANAKNESSSMGATAAIDTMPKPSKPAPPTAVVLELVPKVVLPPATAIRVTATGIVNLAGNPGTSTRVFATAKPDSSGKRPPAPPDTIHLPPRGGSR